MYTNKYDIQAQQEQFRNDWVRREDYNELLDRLHDATQDAWALRTRLRAVDELLQKLDDAETEARAVMMNLRNTSDALRRSVELVEADVEQWEDR